MSFFLLLLQRDTQPSFYGQHYSLTYFHKRCGTDVEAVSGAVVNARGGGFYTMKGRETYIYIICYNVFTSHLNKNELPVSYLPVYLPVYLSQI